MNPESPTTEYIYWTPLHPEFKRPFSPPSVSQLESQQAKKTAWLTPESEEILSQVCMSIEMGTGDEDGDQVQMNPKASIPKQNKAKSKVWDRRRQLGDMSGKANYFPYSMNGRHEATYTWSSNAQWGCLFTLIGHDCAGLLVIFIFTAYVYYYNICGMLE